MFIFKWCLKQNIYNLSAYAHHGPLEDSSHRFRFPVTRGAEHKVGAVGTQCWIVMPAPCFSWLLCKPFSRPPLPNCSPPWTWPAMLCQHPPWAVVASFRGQPVSSGPTQPRAFLRRNCPARSLCRSEHLASWPYCVPYDPHVLHPGDRTVMGTRATGSLGCHPSGLLLSLEWNIVQTRSVV